MISATTYVINSDGTIQDQNGCIILNIPNHPNPFQYVRDFVTNVRSKTYNENWEQLGDILILNVA